MDRILRSAIFVESDPSPFGLAAAFWITAAFSSATALGTSDIAATMPTSSKPIKVTEAVQSGGVRLSNGSLRTDDW